MSGEGNSPPRRQQPPRQSPYSPFPFGSPLGMTSKSVRANGDPKKTETNATDNDQAQAANGLSFLTSNATTTSTSLSLPNAFGNNSIYLKGRVRAKEAYGGPVMFGGQATSFRKGRMIAASPYAAAAIASRKPHQRPLFEDTGSSSIRQGSSAANTPSPAPSPSPSSTTSDNGVMSSTARLIFDTLEKMSTPVRDAQKLIPSVSSSPPRAEKRRLIAEQLDWSQDALKRRRPHLSRASSGSDQLNGPPLRTIFSPVPENSSSRSRSRAAKSARLPPSAGGSGNAPDSTPTSTRIAGQNSVSFGQNLTNASSSSLLFSKPPPQIDLFSTAPEKKSPTSSKQLLTTRTNPSAASKHPQGWESATLSTTKQSGSTGGKMRTRISESMHQKAADPMAINDTDPVPAFLASRNASLPVKAMPTFNFGPTGSNSTSPLSRHTSTATTVPLQDSSPLKLESPEKISQGSTSSFQFSNPLPALDKCSKGMDVDDVMPNGIVFSFCQPKEVVKTPPQSSSWSATANPGTVPSPNFGVLAKTNAVLSSPTSTVPDISMHKNHATLPDLTMRSSAPRSMGVGHHTMGGLAPAKSLKSGSVLDILNRK